MASWKRRDRPWFALLEFALSVEVPRGIADERDSADRTVTPTGNKTKMNGFVEISTLLIHSAPKQKSNEWMHLSPFYTRMHGEWLRYAKSTSQFHWRFLLVRDVRGFQVNPLCCHDITRSDRQIGNNLLADLMYARFLWSVQTIKGTPEPSYQWRHSSKASLTASSSRLPISKSHSAEDKRWEKYMQGCILSSKEERWNRVALTPTSDMSTSTTNSREWSGAMSIGAETKHLFSFCCAGPPERSFGGG